MKTIFTVLLLILFLPSTASAHGTTDVEIAMDIYNKLTVTVEGPIIFPSIYDDRTGTLTSSDSTEVIEVGEDVVKKGRNACLAITGAPEALYSLVFSETTTVVSSIDSNSTLVVNLSMELDKKGGKKSGRMMGKEGTDSACVKGSINLTGNLTPGSIYTNEGSPVVITAVYDAIQ